MSTYPQEFKDLEEQIEELQDERKGHIDHIDQLKALLTLRESEIEMLDKEVEGLRGEIKEAEDALVDSIKIFALEVDKRDRKIENMYRSISEIDDDAERVNVQLRIEAKQKEDARTVEPMFKKSNPTLKDKI